MAKAVEPFKDDEDTRFSDVKGYAPNLPEDQRPEHVPADQFDPHPEED